MRSRPVHVLALSMLLTAAAVAAQPVDPVPCSTLVVDAVPENGFTIGAGQNEIEICGVGSVPTISQGFHCGWGGRAHIQKLAGQWTALSSLPEVQFGFAFRLDDAGLPGEPIDPMPLPGTMPSAPIFPNATETEQEPEYIGLSSELFRRRLENRWQLLNHDIWACGDWSIENQGRFVTADRSGSTPLRDCRIQEKGSGLWEACADQDPLLRAVGFGLHAAPIAGFASSDQVFPAIPENGFSASIDVYYTGSPLPQEPPPGDNTFRFRIAHDVPNPTAAHLHRGYPGVDGPIVHTFSDPVHPIDAEAIVLPLETVRELGANQLYIDIHNAAHPGGAVRGQLIPAQPGIFGNGFEMGDTSGWSFTQP